MQRHPVGRDVGLTLRMVFVAGCLAAVYACVVVGFWFGVRVYRPLLFVIPGLVVLEWFMGDRAVLSLAGVRIVDEKRAPQLHATLDRLAALADVPKPKVGIIESRLPNALAVGRRQKNAVVAVTTALQKKLNAVETEAVLAHELAHIANRDALVMTSASTLRMLGVRLYYWPTWPIAVLLMGLGALLTATLSRYREYAADRTSALLTGRPEALMSALQKISAEVPQIPRRDLREASALNAFFIVPTRRQRRFALAMDHPPLEKRLAALASLARAMGKPA